jgi:hypothetical protein
MYALEVRKKIGITSHDDDDDDEKEENGSS